MNRCDKSLLRRDIDRGTDRPHHRAVTSFIFPIFRLDINCVEGKKAMNNILYTAVYYAGQIGFPTSLFFFLWRRKKHVVNLLLGVQ